MKVKNPSKRTPVASRDHISPQLRPLATSIDSLALDPANARQHDERGIASIKASLRRFGQLKPVVVQAKGRIVRAGNATVVAARELGWMEIAANVKSMTDVEARAYAIADNRTAELATWDDAKLLETIQALKDDPTIDEVVTGFSDDEFAELVARLNPPEIVEDEVPDPPVDPITKPGDLWLLGDHRVLCGDSTKGEDVGRVMRGEKAGMCFTSPPYAQQRDYTDASNVSDWDGLMRGVFANLPMADDGQVLVNLGLIHRDGEWIPYWQDWTEWMRSRGWRRFGWYVWDKIASVCAKNNGRPQAAHEWVFHFNRQAVPCIEWVECVHAGAERPKTCQRGRDGRVRPRCTPGRVKSHKPPDTIARILCEHDSREEAGAQHPARFPVAFADYWLCTWPGDVFDPFLGSGTTLVAAEQLNRRCYGIEIEPRYVDVTVKRWEKLTGRKAKRDTGRRKAKRKNVGTQT